MKQHGVRLVLDDFGAAHSSFSYLMSFPFSQIEIGKALVWALGNGASATAVAEAVLGMARAMRLDVVAVGVEMPEQFEWVRCLGCRYIQGFRLGRPGPAPDGRVSILRIGDQSPETLPNRV